MKKPLAYRIWFKVLMACCFFLPIITEATYKPQDTFIVIAEVLKNPIIGSIPAILPVAKLILLAVTLYTIFTLHNSEKVILVYYSVILLLTGLFQNMSETQYGVSYILGNTVVQWTIITFCLYDLIKRKTHIYRTNFDKRMIWVIPLMLFAILMPYTLQGTTYVPGFQSIFTNAAGLTYCMVTPIVVGLLLLFHQSIYKPTLNVIAYAGLLFGIFSMTTWFVFDNANWWLGFVRLPLLIISGYGVWVSRYTNYQTGIRQQGHDNS